jgi:hypothetical protein
MSWWPVACSQRQGDLRTRAAAGNQLPSLS